MFTFSFGSAFAATDYNKSLAGEYFNVAMSVVKDAGTVTLDGYAVDYATLEANRADLLAAANDWAKAFDTTSGNAQAYIDGQADRTIADLLADADNADLKLAIVAAQYATDKADATAVLNGVSVSDFSTEAMDPKCTVDGHACKTYQDHVQAILNDAVADINKATFNSDSTVADYVAAKAVIAKYFEDYGASMSKTALLLEKGYMGANSEPVGLGVYELNLAYLDNGTPLSCYTADYINAQGAVDTATIAAVKASVAAAYANYVREDNADKDFAADMMKVLNYLADQKVIATTDVATYFNVSYKAAVAQAIKNVEAFEADAAKLAAEKDATGALVRDAADVAKLVTEGTTTEYAKAIGIELENKKTISQAIVAIKALYATLDDAKLAYYKKYVENDINTKVADDEDKYYAPEYAKVKALAEDYIAQINAAADNEAIDKLVTKLNTEIAKVEPKTSVNTKTDNAKLFAAAKQYAMLLNSQITKKANRYYGGSNDAFAKLKSDIYELVGASDARTASAIVALSDQALALVKELPTEAAVEAAKDAADEAVKALPTKVSTADKALIDAAIAAVDAYETLSGETYTTTAIESAALRYAYAFNNEMNAKVKAVSKTDKDAIKALLAEIKAVEDAYDYASVKKVLEENKADLNEYLDKIQKTEFDAVKAAINAIPAAQNITDADKATVEAARKLYDAYVAEYTEYDSAFYWNETPTDGDGFVADDFAASYQELVAAETLLGLNAEDPAKAVEALKIKASSKATKGAMTIKWRVVGGDKSAVQGYQVKRSTKLKSGFKTMIKTTKMTYKNTKNLKKGTRYYYKVRAYKVVDGKNVYSDWSNKAYRVAK